MGLGTTHDCWHGPYSAFHDWRRVISQVSGYGNLDDRVGFGGDVPWPSSGDDPWPTIDPLIILLNHSDCDGDIKWQDCWALADRLESLLPAVRINDNGIGRNAELTARFINGLREAYRSKEDVLFH